MGHTGVMVPSPGSHKKYNFSLVWGEGRETWAVPRGFWRSYEAMSSPTGGDQVIPGESVSAGCCIFQNNADKKALLLLTQGNR